MSDRSLVVVSASVLVVCALLVLGSCLVFLLFPSPEGFFLLLYRLPGKFLFESFHAASFFVPLYVFAAAILLLFQAAPRPSLILLNISILPFFTIGIILRLIFLDESAIAPLFDLLVTNFSKNGAIVLSFLLLAVELGLMLQLYRILSARKMSDQGKKREEKRLLIEDRNRGGLFNLPDPEEFRDQVLPEGMQQPQEKGVSEDEWAWNEAEEDEIDEIEVLPVFEEAFNNEEEENRDAGAQQIWDDGEGIGDEQIRDGGDPRGDNVQQKPAPRNGKKYNVPLEGLLVNYGREGYGEIDEETRRASEILRVTLEEFKIQAEVTGIKKGPVITMFEILPAPGVKLSKITNLADNIALRLAASRVRIVAPIPGKHAVGIEIPNKKRNIVSFAEMITHEDYLDEEKIIPIALGKDISGDAEIIDLTKTPHILIAGATGSGKSVCVNSIIGSILFRKPPNEVKLLLIDPKIVELKFYNDIPHLLTSVVTEPKKAFQALQYCIYEMERRYSLLDSLGARDIAGYNAKIKKRKLATEPLPYIVIIVDEFADLMQTSGKELETTVARLAAMSRAVGIHLVLATQRPSIDVITGLIKANIPSRIAFMVASKFDSRIIIDSVGAEKLLGGGDMLFTSSWNPFPVRMQGSFLSEEEVDRIVAHVKTLGEPDYLDDEIFFEDDEEAFFEEDGDDPLLEKAIEIVTSANRASASYIQRRLKVGYNRAARLIESMERMGIVGPQNGSKAREILQTN